MLQGPIYPLLVKEFWKYARISEDGNIIWSQIYGLPISVTISSIEKVTECVSEGVTVEDFQTNLGLLEKFKILFDSSAPYEPNNPEYLLPHNKILFQFSLSNLRPRANARGTMSQEDRVIVFLLSYHFKINLPKTIFNHLKYSIAASRKQSQAYIPYGRILSEIIFQEGI